MLWCCRSGGSDSCSGGSSQHKLWVVGMVMSMVVVVLKGCMVVWMVVCIGVSGVCAVVCMVVCMVYMVHGGVYCIWCVW